MLDTLRKDVPQPAFVLGFLGAVPFVGLALLGGLGGATGSWAMAALLAYGAIILSFMGGVHWGWAMAADEPSFSRLGVSVLPSLLGWAAFLVGASFGLVVLAAGFAALLRLDLQAISEGRAASWYRTLRLRLTLIVVASLLAASIVG